MEIPQTAPSAFAQLVNKLRDKSEEELKLLYLKFFANELNEEWKQITEEATLKVPQKMIL